MDAGAAGQALAGDANFAGDWWAPGLALHERLRGSRPLNVVVDDRSRERLAGWRARYDALGADLFARRLAEAGTDENTVLALLAEPRSALTARVSRPAWAEAIERAVRAAAPLPTDERIPVDWRESLARPWHPLIRTVLVPTIERLAPLVATARIDLPAVTVGVVGDLRRRLTRLAVRTLVRQLHACRDSGQLVGENSQQRFADFVRQLCEPERLAVVFATYPVLARRLAQTTVHEADAIAEILTRFAADREHIVGAILAGADPGPLREIVPSGGECHQNGRLVRMLRFADGRRVVYKPRGIEAQHHLANLMARLNAAIPELASRTPAIVARPGYGWMEFIAHSPARDGDGVTLFYQRLGALLALCHVVHATDMHCENLVACGDQPVVVDAETLFHPVLPSPRRAADPAARALAVSVARTGLLPSFELIGDGPADISGFGGDVTTASRTVVDWEAPGTDQMRLMLRPARLTNARNRPWVTGETFAPDEYRDAILYGLGRAYRAISRDRSGLTALMAASGTMDVRVVLRPSRGYQTLLDRMNDPEMLRDALECDQLFDVLWTEAADDRLRWMVAKHEATELWSGDVPLFHCRPDARDVSTGTGAKLVEVLETPPLSRAVETVAALDEADRRNQEWIAAATLATRVAVSDPHGGRGGLTLTSVAAHPERLLAAACAIADQLVALAVTDGERFNWLGLELVDDRQWLVMPMGAGLANGYLGVALFLAQLSRVTGIRRHADVARRATRSYRRFHDAVSTHPSMAIAVGCGGLYGLGGIAYALARLAVLLADEEIATQAAQTVELAAAAAELTDEPGWANGLAGCLAAMMAAHADLNIAAAAELAVFCADRLVDLTEPVLDRFSTSGARHRIGFADGTAGMSYGLARAALAQPRYLASAHALLEHGRSILPLDVRDGTKPGWCSGLAGRLVAEAAAGRVIEEDADPAVRDLAQAPLVADLSLCHGELGIVESLTALRRSEPTTQCGFLGDAIRRHAGLVLNAIRQHGPICGTPDAVPTPGLLNGLAGIGYGLLRLASTAQVPSVLLLEPRRLENGIGRIAHHHQGGIDAHQPAADDHRTC
jgi:type 2 lantibiotic biosynthesis protein LanM